MTLAVRFFRLESGEEPVRTWISKECSKEDRRQIGEDIRYVQAKFPKIGLPTWRPLGAGLYEVRSNLSGRRISRILVCVADDEMLLLHAFIKKTRKTPEADLKLARTRQRAAKGR